MRDITHQSASFFATVRLYIQTRSRWKAMESVRIFFTEEFLQT